MRDPAPTGADAPDHGSPNILQFGPFAFEVPSGRLSREGVDLHLTPKAAAVLGHLLAHADELVTKDEFLDAVWPDVHVREESLTQAISVIRHALGDSSQNPQFIQTVPGEGYRFIGNVSVGAAEAPTNETATSNRAAATPDPEASRVSPEPSSGVAPASTTPPRTASSRPGPALPRGLIPAAVVIVVAVAALAWLSPTEEAERGSAGNDPLDVRPLTSLPGYENYPELSPDGRQVAFMWDEGDGPHLYVQFVSGGDAARLVPARYGDPAWGPNGEHIAYMTNIERPSGDANPAGREIRTVTALGTDDRTLTTTSSNQSGLDWSRDGRFLAFPDRPGPGQRDNIFLVSPETGDRHQATFHEDDEATFDSSPAFSPDGRLLAFLRIRAMGGGGGYVHVQELDDEGRPVGPSRRLASPHGFLHDVDWTADGSSVVYSGGPTIDYPFLTRVPLDGSKPSRLGAGDHARDFSIEGRQLVFSQRQDDVDLWRIGGPAAERTGVPEPWGSSTRDDQFPDYSPDGEHVTFISGRGGMWDVWVADADGGDPRQLSDLGHATRPRWAPDGRSIAFNVASPDQTDVYVVDPNEGVPQNLTEDDFRDAIPGWSEDGESIYFQSRGRVPGPEQGPWEIWKMSRDGNDLTRVPEVLGIRPLHYGGRLYVNTGNRLLSHPEHGGEGAIVLDHPVDHARWALWRGKVVFMEQGERGTAVIKIFDLESGNLETHAAVPVPGGWVRTEGTLEVSPDGRFILYSAKGKPGGADLILVENFR